MRKHKSFRRMLSVLRERCPTIVPVRVRRTSLPQNTLGECWAVKDGQKRLVRFNIRIERSLSWDATWQILIHEWAHALAWREGHECLDDHDEAWGLAYSYCYRELE